MQRPDTSKQAVLQRAREVRILSNFEMLKVIEQLPKLDTIKTTSFPTLNKIIEGFLPGELIAVTGAPGCGKTLFCQTLTMDFSNDTRTPLWFTFEVAPRYFIPKFARNAVDLQFFLPAKLEPYSVEWIVEVSKRGIADLGIEAIFVDHLHFVFNFLESNKPSLDIGHVVGELKRLAVENEIVVFLCCPVTKARIVDINDIGLHSIRDSSLVAHWADTVIFVHRIVSDTGVCKTMESFLKVCKARRSGDMGTVINTVKHNEYLSELGYE